MGMESGDIDLQALNRLRQLGGDELISKMVMLFITQADSLMQEITASLHAGDLDAVRLAAHSLRSSAGNLGAQQVQSLAEKIEELAERSDGGSQAVLVPLQNAYLRAKDRLTQEMKEVEE